MGHLSLPCAIDGVMSEVYPACPMESFYPIPSGPAPFNSLQKRSEVYPVKPVRFLFNWGGFNQGETCLFFV
jgi:hypothetical protein